MKRALDIVIAAAALTVMSPVLLLVTLAVWLQDFGSPFYIPARAARGGGEFRMVKFRSMVLNADKKGASSTAGDDARITRVGHLIRRYKLDELIQLWNVLRGDMSLVGPRPQVVAEAKTYTSEEMRLLSVRPGITDISSIVFADEGEILKGSRDPDLLYNQIIRPWKSRLSLLSIDHGSLATDCTLIGLTIVGIFSRQSALARIRIMLEGWQADPFLIRMAARQEDLVAYPPPGASEIVSLAR